MLKREAFMRQSVGWTDKIQYPSFPELVSDEEMVQLLVEANPGYTIRLWRIIEKVGGAFYESRRISEAQTLEIIAKAYHYHFSPLFLFCSGYIS
jgi:hypothetical protein